MYIIGLVLCGGVGVSFRQRKLRGAFVFEIKKTKAPKLKLKTVSRSFRQIQNRIFD